jgi:peptide/nickel transport system substrate-binding protein
MNQYLRLGLYLAIAASVVVVAAGFGGKAADSSTIIIGTTDQLVSFDPAASGETDNFNLYQGLLHIPPGKNAPAPDAAQTCGWQSALVYECTLKPGLKFSNGQSLTSADVKFSIDRLISLKTDTGLSYLFGSLSQVVTPNPTTVVFQLKKHDSTWPFLLSTAAAVIVPTGVYSATAVQSFDNIVGSGPYTLASYKAGEQAVFKPNPNYTGSTPPKNSLVIVQYFSQASALKLAIERGDIDVAYRSLSPTDIKSLRSNKNVKVITGDGAETRYIVFNLKLAPSKTAAVRQAIAYSINRAAIAKNVYDGTVKPLYSMVPAGYAGHVDAYATAYGRSPNVAKARALLKAAHITTPVPVQIWWTPSHYGPLSGDEYIEIQRQLQATGLFKVKLSSTEWQQYAGTALGKNVYPAFELGWTPDYPDATDYTTPFYGSTAILGNHYANAKVIKLVNAAQLATTDATRLKDLEQIQLLAAKDSPTLPIWQGEQLAVVRSNVKGVQSTFDPSFTLRYALISK